MPVVILSEAKESQCKLQGNVVKPVLHVYTSSPHLRGYKRKLKHSPIVGDITPAFRYTCGAAAIGAIDKGFFILSAVRYVRLVSALRFFRFAQNDTDFVCASSII